MNDQCILGIEIGGTKLQAALGDSQGNVLHRSRSAANSAAGAFAIVCQLEELVARVLNESDRTPVGMGIGFGGPMDYSRGAVIKSNHVEGWTDFPLRDWAETTFGYSCALANDTDVAALVEANVVSRANDRCVYYTNIGSGIGGGLANVGQPLLVAIQDRIKKIAYAPFANSYRIELTACGELAVPIGAILLAADRQQSTR